MSLDKFLGADDASDAPAQSAEASKAAATDGKPADTGKQPDAAASATSAEQATQRQAKPDGEQKPEGEAGKEASQTRDQQGRFTKQEAGDEVTGLRTALRQERQRRQQLERQKQGDQGPPKFNYDDPDQSLEQRDQRLRTEMESRFYDLCEEQAKVRHADFAEIVDPLVDDAAADPSLGQQVFAHIRAAKDPAEALYRFARNRRELQSVGGDLGQYKAGIEAPLTARIKDLEAKLAASEQKLANLSKVPSSLNSEGSAAPSTVAEEAADEKESLSSIVEPRKKRRA